MPTHCVLGLAAAARVFGPALEFSLTFLQRLLLDFRADRRAELLEERDGVNPFFACTLLHSENFGIIILQGSVWGL